MNLLESAGFALNPCIYAPFITKMSGAIFASFQVFAGNFGKIVGKRGMLTDEMLAQKESAVKSKRAKRKGLRPKPEALIIQLVTLGSRGKQACKPSDIVRYGTLPDSQLLYIRTDKHPTHQYQMQKHPPP